MAKTVGATLETAAAQGGAGAAPGVRSSTGGHGEPSVIPSVVLPTVPRPVKANLHNLVTFIYGPPKIGKSTLASEFGRVLFIEMEPGLSGLEVLTTGHIHSWTQFCEAVNLVVADGGQSYDAVCIDTVDMAAERCSEHTNARLGIMHESDLDFGKGWTMAKKELHRWINKLASVPNTGLLFISHSQEVEIKTNTAAYNKAVPTLGKGARQLFLDMSDLILYCDYDGEGGDMTRVLRAEPSRYWIAGDRFNRLSASIPWPAGHGFSELSQAWGATNKENKT